MSKNINLRKVFIQLLFSLAISQVALRVGELVDNNINFWDYHYSYFHLILAVIIITTSWVGWQMSKAPLNSDLIINVFSWQYIVFLVDLFLVITYFIIVRGVELPISNTTLMPPPDTYNETFWSLVIFITYLIWDIVTKIYVPEFQVVDGKDSINNNNFRRIRKYNKTFFKRMLPTIICTLIAWFIFKTMGNETTGFFATVTDLTLIFLFLTFRGLKQEIKKNYKLEESRLSDESIEKIKSMNSSVSFPIIMIESKSKYVLKIIFVKILPFLFLILSIIIYCFYK